MEEHRTTRKVTQGVPRRYVVLRNFGQMVPVGMQVICYADVEVGKGGLDFETHGDSSGGYHQEDTKLVLEIAAEKAEAIWMHVVLRIHKPSLTWLFVQGKRIRVKEDLKNRGNILGGSFNFVTHFNRISPKMEGVSALLVRVLLNLAGPGNKERHLYTELIKSMVLYGSSIWDDT